MVHIANDIIPVDVILAECREEIGFLSINL
jgi:hypothetical protein